MSDDIITVTLTETVTREIVVEVPRELFGDDEIDFNDDPPYDVREHIYETLDRKGWEETNIHNGDWKMEEPEVEFMEDDDE